VGLHQPELLNLMCDAIAHRGPDDFGSWTDAEAGVGLGHRRLSIIDLSPAGHQPMSNADGTVWISYNGELYNFQEHRKRLADAGYPFRSQSDTEVLIALYEERGIDFLQELNGMFAFALWDAREQRLLIARDHAGIKPLYYRAHEGRLWFASEMKALLRVPGTPRQLRHQSVVDFLTFLWVPGPYTMLEGIHKLEPGHYLTWQNGEVHTRPWFSIAYEPDENPSEDEWVEEVHSTFMSTTRRQMISDVPLGAFLSGGLDSSSIVACMRESYPHREIDAYTVRFQGDADMAAEQGVDDFPYAVRVADSLGVNLRSVDLEPGVIGLLPKMVYHLDEPDADPAVFPSYLISKLARESGTTVLLSGTGGDEVFFGYRSHRAYREYARFGFLLPFPLQAVADMGRWLSTSALGAQNRWSRRVARFARGLNTDGLERHLALADWSRPEIRSDLLRKDLAVGLNLAAGPGCLQKYYDTFEGEGELNRHSHLLNQTFLAAHNFLYTDKSSMAVSLEARVPFMDVELMRLAARIPEHHKLNGGVTKFVLKRAMERHLPSELIHRQKTGFGVPLRQWIQGDLRRTIDEFLSPERIERRGLFEVSAVQRILAEMDANREDHAYLIYALLTLEIWLQTFLDQPGVEVSI
jgi:asparagine synthase (glutamine-hydrolysing)